MASGRMKTAPFRRWRHGGGRRGFSSQRGLRIVLRIEFLENRVCRGCAPWPEPPRGLGLALTTGPRSHSDVAGARARLLHCLRHRKQQCRVTVSDPHRHSGSRGGNDPAHEGGRTAVGRIDHGIDGEGKEVLHNGGFARPAQRGNDGHAIFGRLGGTRHGTTRWFGVFSHGEERVSAADQGFLVASGRSARTPQGDASS